MDFGIDYNGYYVALIILTIVTIAISIALSFYFIFLPAIRIENEFDILQARGLQAIQDVTRLINTTTNLSAEIQKDVCQSTYYTLDKLLGKPFEDGVRGCLIGGIFCAIDVIPDQCVQYISEDQIPLCCRTQPDTCPS